MRQDDEVARDRGGVMPPIARGCVPLLAALFLAAGISTIHLKRYFIAVSNCMY